MSISNTTNFFFKISLTRRCFAEILTVLESPKSPRALLAIEYNLSLCGFPFLGSIPSGITPIDCPSLYGISPNQNPNTLGIHNTRVNSRIEKTTKYVSVFDIN